MTEGQYSDEKLKQVEKILSASIRKALKAGLVLGQGAWTLDFAVKKAYPVVPSWTTSENKCCLIGAMLLDKQPPLATTFNSDIDTKARASACAHLGVSYAFVHGLIRAYDSINITYAGNFDSGSNDEIFIAQYNQGIALGLKLGNKFLKKDNENV